jgi:inhibitor of cysteine peptidase
MSKMGVVSLVLLSLLAIMITACGGETSSVQKPREVQGTGSIEGTVRTAGGEPAQAVVLTIISGSAPFPEMAHLSNAEGFYRFPGIAAGTFEVAVHDGQGNKLVVQSVEVKAGEATAVEFILPSEDESELGMDDNGSEVELHKGQTFVVTLDSNPTTGFSWGVGTIDEEVVQQVGQPIFEAESQLGEVVGAGGSETLRFLAAGTGESDLQLTYRRPWEEAVKPEQVFEISIVVR